MNLGEEVFRTQDAYGEINVYQGEDRRSLCFGTPVEQSSMLLSDPAQLQFDYTRAMMLAPLFTPPPRLALVLGLGGGSLARALHRHFPRCRITAVEQRAAVVEVARQWFELPDDHRLGVHVGDAQGFLAERQPSAELIFADLYDGEGMDAQQMATEFFALCRQSLSPGGVAAFNLWSGRYFRDQAIKEALDAVFDGQVLRLSAPGRNRIVFGFRDPIPALQEQPFCEQAQQLGLRMGFPLLRAARQLWVLNHQQLRG
jgi:spermidine synthase